MLITFLSGVISAQINDTGDAIACSVDTSYTGGEAYPSEVQVTLGTSTGLVYFEFASYNVPDKFQVILGGDIVLDTGYIGSPNQQSALDNELTNRGDPLEEIKSAPWLSFSEPKLRNRLFFVKETTHTTATVKVWAPLPNTEWDFSLRCPEPDDDSNKTYEVFTTSGDFTVPLGVSSVDVLLVGGGGGGGPGKAMSATPGAGGGAGGLLIFPNLTVTPGGTLPVVVGPGGSGGASGSPPQNGGSSTFNGLIAQGGGAGSNGGIAEGMDGGSGGGSGCCASSHSPGVGYGTQGNRGGNLPTTDFITPYSTPGGGGYSSVGQDGLEGDADSGAGGDGISLADVYWPGAVTAGAPSAVAGGGGGGCRAPSGVYGPRNGGLGGGGDGGEVTVSGSTPGQNGTANTGGGGGGAGSNDSSPVYSGGNGGSGLVIIRYDTP